MYSPYPICIENRVTETDRTARRGLSQPGGALSRRPDSTPAEAKNAIRRSVTSNHPRTDAGFFSQSAGQPESAVSPFASGASGRDGAGDMSPQSLARPYARETGLATRSYAYVGLAEGVGGPGSCSSEREPRASEPDSVKRERTYRG